MWSQDSFLFPASWDKTSGTCKCRQLWLVWELWLRIKYSWCSAFSWRLLSSVTGTTTIRSRLSKLWQHLIGGDKWLYSSVGIFILGANNPSEHCKHDVLMSYFLLKWMAPILLYITPVTTRISFMRIRGIFKKPKLCLLCLIRQRNKW